MGIPVQPGGCSYHHRRREKPFRNREQDSRPGGGEVYDAVFIIFRLAPENVKVNSQTR